MRTSVWIPAAAVLLSACTTTRATPVAAPAAPAPAAAVARDTAWPPARPIPYPVTPTPEFQAAVRAATRTETGRPGQGYWTNGADYSIRVRLLPETHAMEGSETIRYHNRSPDALPVLVMDLIQNLHAPGAVRLEPVEVTGGVKLSRVVVAGEELHSGRETGARYEVDGTKLYLVPSRPVQPGTTVELSLDWSFTVPQAGAGARMGYSDGLYFLAYFYPQMSVYDDVVGWQRDQFLSPAEFYADYGSYDVTLEVPAGWVVTGTGRLQEPEKLLAPEVLARLRSAAGSDSVVHVLGAADLGRATVARTGRATWSFHADSVRDVAYSVTRRSLWDATRTSVGDRDGDGRPEYALVEALYREPAFRWRNAARYGADAIAFLSDYTGLPYAWPHMTIVEGEGIIGGGMEYPMATLIGSYTQASDTALYGVIAHELGHMWVPMMVSTDERRYGWMDEGTTDFNETQASKHHFPGSEPEERERQRYLRLALRGGDGEMMRWSDYHYPGGAYVNASYYKPATVLYALRGLLGEETFDRAFREFFQRWKFRHPYPWDLWNTFEDVSGRDLDWFWRTWYYETWLLDQAVAAVAPTGDSTTIVVEDHGRAPMPARLTLTMADGSTLSREVPVEVWLNGARRARVTVPGTVTRVEIDAAHDFPDANRADNVWPAP